MTIDTKLGPEEIAELKAAWARLNAGPVVMRSMMMPDEKALFAALPALIAAAERCGEVEADIDGFREAVKAANMVGGVHYEQAVALRQERDDALSLLRTLAAKLASLTDRITEIADDALGLQVPGTPLHVMLGALSKAYHDERIAKIAAEAKLAEVSQGLRSLAHSHDGFHTVDCHAEEGTNDDEVCRLDHSDHPLECAEPHCDCGATASRDAARAVAAKGAGR